jgi:putative membrane protein
MEENGSRFDVQPTASNHFAWMNTEMALQRTLMSGVRTGISLIGFGFTVAQFFERIRDKVPAANQVAPNAPRNLGLTLIVAGVALVALFLWQYRTMNAYMWTGPYRELAGMHGRHQLSGPYYAAWVVLLIGLAAFLSVFFHF